MMKRLLPLLLAVVLSSGCGVLAGINWDAGHLANAGAKAAVAATMSDEQISDLCRQHIQRRLCPLPGGGALPFPVFHICLIAHILLFMVAGFGAVRSGGRRRPSIVSADDFPVDHAAEQRHHQYRH